MFRALGSPLRTAGLTMGALLLSGCAALNTVTSEVATYGDWPAGRAPGRYVFERLPSQQAQAERQAALEAAAAAALDKAGFTRANDTAPADVVVQIGARVDITETAPWDDPLWWRWGVRYWRAPTWHPTRAATLSVGFSAYRYTPYMSLRADWGTRYARSVALLLRDRASGTPLYEAHAQTEGHHSGSAALWGAMFEAALKDFPATDAKNPRAVSVTLQAR